MGSGSIPWRKRVIVQLLVLENSSFIYDECQIQLANALTLSQEQLRQDNSKDIPQLMRVSSQVPFAMDYEKPGLTLIHPY